MAVNYIKTYADVAADAQRQQKLADFLQKQADQPLDMPTYQGFAAMPSYAAGLAKILSAYGARKAGERAEESQKLAKKIGREEFKDYMSAFEPTERKLGTALDVAAARPEDQTMAAMLPQNLDMSEIAKSIGAPTAGVAPQGTGPQFQAPQFAVGGAPMTVGQRRAKLLEGLASDNPMIAAAAQAEYAKPSMLGKIGDVAPDKFTPASLAQYQATGNAAVLVPVERENKAPTAVQEYEYAQRQGYKGSFRDFQNERARAGATTISMGAPVAGVDEQGNPVFFQPSKTGGTPSIVPGVRPSPKGMTQEQGKVAGFADRVQASNEILSSPPPDLMTAKVADAIPGGNFMLNAPQQKFLQAERDFINAMLRRESGAAIAPSEFESARKQYIPQPGDRPETLEQKRLARERAFSGLARELGPTYKPNNVAMPSATGGWGKAEVVR